MGIQPGQIRKARGKSENLDAIDRGGVASNDFVWMQVSKSVDPLEIRAILDYVNVHGPPR